MSLLGIKIQHFDTFAVIIEYVICENKENHKEEQRLNKKIKLTVFISFTHSNRFMINVFQ